MNPLTITLPHYLVVSGIVFGLGIAITAVIPFNIFRRRVVDLRHKLEYTANRIEVALALAASKQK